MVMQSYLDVPVQIPSQILVCSCELIFLDSSEGQNKMRRGIYGKIKSAEKYYDTYHDSEVSLILKKTVLL